MMKDAVKILERLKRKGSAITEDEHNAIDYAIKCIHKVHRLEEYFAEVEREYAKRFKK